MKTLLLIGMLVLAGCSSTKIMRDCKHMGQNYYKCEDARD